jgi:hypothetical protein
MSQTIPLRSDLQHYDMQVTLDGVIYTLELRWNRREGFWYMSLLLEDGTPLVLSLKLVLDHPLGCRCRDARRPPGALIAVDTSTQHLDPGLSDLGSRVLLVYFEKVELPIDVSTLVVE